MSEKDNWSKPMKVVVLILFGWLVISLVVAVGCNLQKFITPNLPVAPGPASRTDGCIVSPQAAKVHKNHDASWVQFVNEDSTIQVQTVDTKLAILFEIKPHASSCFQKGSIVPVTISDCVKNSKNECDFSRLHSVYVRSEPVKVLNWKYYKSAY